MELGTWNRFWRIFNFTSCRISRNIAITFYDFQNCVNIFVIFHPPICFSQFFHLQTIGWLDAILIWNIPQFASPYNINHWGLTRRRHKYPFFLFLSLRRALLKQVRNKFGNFFCFAFVRFLSKLLFPSSALIAFWVIKKRSGWARRSEFKNWCKYDEMLAIFITFFLT